MGHQVLLLHQTGASLNKSRGFHCRFDLAPYGLQNTVAQLKSHRNLDHQWPLYILKLTFLHPENSWLGYYVLFGARLIWYHLYHFWWALIRVPGGLVRWALGPPLLRHGDGELFMKTRPRNMHRETRATTTSLTHANFKQKLYFKKNARCY